jgi:hypothetical protein
MPHLDKPHVISEVWKYNNYGRREFQRMPYIVGELR